MKYSKNITSELKSLGFFFIYDNSKESDDEDLKYEVWKNGCIEITIEHSPSQKVIVDLMTTDNPIKIASRKELELITKIVNR